MPSALPLLLVLLTAFAPSVRGECVADNLGKTLDCVDVSLRQISQTFQKSWKEVESARIRCKAEERNPPKFSSDNLRNLSLSRCASSLPDNFFSASPNLEAIDLSNNSIRFVPTSTGSLKRLRTFTFADNYVLILNLDDFLTVTELTCSRNRIKAIHSLRFHGISQEIPLEFLYLDNNVLGKLSKDDFGGLGRLRVLDVSYNFLPVVEAGSFDGLGKLEKLYLRQNVLKDLPEETFKENRELEVLDLSFCQLKTLRRFFDSNVKLKSLDISGNEFRKLPTGVFEKLTALEDLGLSGLKLEELPAATFSNNPQLKTLDLSNNELLTLPGETLQLLRLQRLNLSFNYFQDLPGETFSHTSLNLLDLSKNFLTNLPPNLFNLPALEALYLTGNELSTLSISSFNCSLDSLKHLDVRENRLVFLRETFLASFLYLKEFELCGNIWDCKCLDVLMKFVEENEISYSRLDYFDGRRSYCVAFNEVECVMNFTNVEGYYRDYQEILREVQTTE